MRRVSHDKSLEEEDENSNKHQELGVGGGDLKKTMTEAINSTASVAVSSKLSLYS